LLTLITWSLDKTSSIHGFVSGGRIYSYPVIKSAIQDSLHRIIP
jgi:hypothetical protein